MLLVQERMKRQYGIICLNLQELVSVSSVSKELKVSMS